MVPKPNRSTSSPEPIIAMPSPTICATPCHVARRTRPSSVTASSGKSAKYGAVYTVNRNRKADVMKIR